MDKNFTEDYSKLNDEAARIRALLVETVSKNGGHLASNLGVVELTLALHAAFDFSRDRLLFDVGHQSYVHKILTGREERFQTLRQRHGIGPFMDPAESDWDPFISGHAGTALAAASGIALACPDRKIVVVIGDAAVANGHSLEALNNIGGKYKNLIVILNDNEMSIGQNVGSLSKFFGRIMGSEQYLSLRKEARLLMKKIKMEGLLLPTLDRLELSVKNFFAPLSTLESLGFQFFGPVDGHNIKEMVETFKKIKRMEGPIFIHLRTQKGKGYAFAEEDREKFHGISPFDPDTGEPLSRTKTYSGVFGEALARIAAQDETVYAISAGMVKGTGLERLFREFPERGLDVGISEGYAVTFAAGLAKAGKKPWVCIYSTFLQRGFSQLIHDVSLQNLPVRFVVDRAGVVGEDGKTHNGLYDIGMFLMIPGFTVISPASTDELREVLDLAAAWDRGPVVIRIPREVAFTLENRKPFELGKWTVIEQFAPKQGGERENLFLAVGSMLRECLAVKDSLLSRGIGGTIVNASSLSPVDEAFLLEEAPKYKRIFVLEETYEHNAFASYVLNFLNDRNIRRIIHKIGIPSGKVPHGDRKGLLAELGLTGEKLTERIADYIDADQKDRQHDKRAETQPDTE
ncbi:MAG: 1-deoxy-D-xylulose-5-phosphate synthase [Fusobacteriaceae bacterium]|jgi:1-deoxy-D-xylulose-5-phosphate synthase|nr:1-deoxy-D-xylulose-5-phosphate synthase [Fusobacteriaceae bacterium]